ncbi:hypothetical protein QWT69_07830 [Sporosarcina oncorhynchi]|uniref:Uncharacterized protein n=1 Tax=Sporosarcina oncorhynchi TaxID=3056444 RepID=A0ABZ0L8Y6_9BACL|nr:hypothetical protein [Sporosarcina sp. T2O-4]WOV89002.1 hypothetical protein QWT69_07830 [Sporosarcina sp. T2O-4]
MELVHWEYWRKYQIKGVFDRFPTTVVIFRQVKNYYFIYSMSGLDETVIPTRKDYVQMEYLLNKELGSLPAYRKRFVFTQYKKTQ